MAPAPIRFDRFYQLVRQWVHVTHTFTLGLFLCVFTGGGVEPRLIAGPSVHVLVLKALRIAAAWCLIALILEPWGWPEFGVHRPWDRKKLLPMLMGACFVLCIHESSQIWAAPGACFSFFFGLVWFQSTPAQRRWPIAPVGWLWGGIYPLTLAWPNQQRLGLGLLIGGIAMTLQGIVEIVGSFRRPADGSQASSGTPSLAPPASL